MSYTKFFSLAACGVLASTLLAASPRGDALKFQVAEGTSLTRSLAIGVTINMDGGTISMMGEEQEIPAEDEPLEVDAAIEVIDNYAKMEDGAVVMMTRSYDTFAVEATDSEDSMDDIELEGEKVNFERDEEGNYTKSLGEDKREAALLNGLELDMDFTVLLPADEVEPGAEWAVKDGNTKSLFLPGGFPGSENDETIEYVISEVAVPLFVEGCEDFAINCTYVGLKKEEEVSLAEISFKFEGSTGGDFADILMAIGDIEGDSGMPEDIEADASVDFEGEGTLLWNVEGGHAHSFEMLVQPTIDLTMDMTQDMGDQTLEMEFAVELSGELEWTMTVE